MTEADAKAKLASMIDAWSTPALSDSDLEALLCDARRPDANGLLVGDAGYAPTWDLNFAAMNGWLLKAAKTSKFYDVTTQSRTHAASQVHDHCVDMANEYRKKLAVSAPVERRTNVGRICRY